MFYEFKGHRPMVDASAFVHPQAAVTGNVVIGKDVYIGPGAAIRGDWGKIIIEDGCNVQENCTIHMFPGVTVLLKEGAHIGHGAIVHGATIGRNCLVGMNSVIMDGVEVGDECIVGALSFIKAGEKIPGRSVVVGNPAKIVKEVSEEMLRWKTEGTAIYQALPGDMYGGWKVCEPRRPGETTGGAEAHGELAYSPWKETRKYKFDEDEGFENIVAEPAAEYGRGKREFTIEDYLEMQSYSLQKHEYYDGEIFAMSGARADHNTIAVNLTALVKQKLKGGSCKVYNGDQRVYVEKNSLFTYPDLTVVCGKPLFYKDDKMNLMNPAVIIEILSPSTKSYDRGEKFKLYKELATLQEYLLVDSQSVLLEHFFKNDTGIWERQKYDQLADKLLMKVPNITLSLEEIYEETEFPKVTH
jgi:phenylacetic acid degradation protein/carnitine operon protein CaiE